MFLNYNMEYWFQFLFSSHVEKLTLTEQLYQGGILLMYITGGYLFVSSLILLVIRVLLKKKLEKEYGLPFKK